MSPTIIPPPGSNRKLKKVQRLVDEAREQYLQRQQKLLDMELDRLAAADPEMRSVAKELREIRNTLHFHRLKMGRKKFSIRIKAKSLLDQQNALTRMEGEEIGMAQTLETLAQKESEIRSRLAGRLRPPTPAQEPLPPMVPAPVEPSQVEPAPELAGLQKQDTPAKTA
jgi:hypothetical protein